MKLQQYPLNWLRGLGQSVRARWSLGGASTPARKEPESFEPPLSLGGFLHHDPAQSRRELLQKALIGIPVAGALIGGVGLLLDKGGQQRPVTKPTPEVSTEEELPPLETIEDPKLHRSGEVISTPGGAIEIRGWKAIMTDLTVKQIEWLAPASGKEYAFAFKEPREGFTRRLFTSQVRHELDFPPDTVTLRGRFQDEKAFYLVPFIPDPVLQLTVVEYPADRPSLEREVFTAPANQAAMLKEHRRQPHKAHVYRIRLSGRHETTRGKEAPSVFAEGPVSQSQLDQVASLRRLLATFGDVAPVYIYGEGDDDLYWQQAGFGQHYDPHYHRIALTYREFAHPDVPDQGLQVAAHELLHSLMERSKLSGPQDAAYQRMREAFYALARLAEAEPGDIRKHPVFAIARELTHYGRPPSKGHRLQAGHPWSNHNELFASVGATLRYYPDRFLGALRKLETRHREPVAAATRAVLAFMRTMNPDPRALGAMFPRLEAIEQAVGRAA